MLTPIALRPPWCESTYHIWGYEDNENHGYASPCGGASEITALKMIKVGRKITGVVGSTS
jgi:hypothetical protein